MTQSYIFYKIKRGLKAKNQPEISHAKCALGIKCSNGNPSVWNKYRGMCATKMNLFANEMLDRAQMISRSESSSNERGNAKYMIWK